MSKSIKIRKGLDIKLKGEADRVLTTPELGPSFCIKPTDFHGLVPKMVKKVGEKVKVGSIVFHDKYNDKIKFTSPVAGEVTDIVRGAKRKILEVRIKADGTDAAESFKTGDANMSREEIVENLLISGVWPVIRQRPVSVIPDPATTPKSIFISGFDSNPLAPDLDFILHQNEELFQFGLDILGKLTEGKVHLNLKAGAAHDIALKGAKGVQLNSVAGPHPAGNVGPQIHQIDPINKGEYVWYLNAQDVLTIARLFKTGKYDASKVVALTGAEVKSPKYYKVKFGANIKPLVDGNVNEGDLRYISGNVLTGDKVDADGYLGFYHNQVTVIPEGHDAQFFLTEGWLSPGSKKLSASRAYFSWLKPNKKYNLKTSLNGEERAFVVSGQYEKVFPFDIYPVQLVKAIMVNDITKMEQLGIYEVDPEDFALCEFVCTSKINSMEIVRGGLDVVHSECL